ncbi:hypothetical protein ACFPRL_34220 [Pseudoclavibacter helvolus]
MGGDPSRRLDERQRPHPHCREPGPRGRHQGPNTQRLLPCAAGCSRAGDQARLGGAGVGAARARDARLRPRGARGAGAVSCTSSSRA